MCLGIPGQLTEIHRHDDMPMGKVAFGGILKDVCLAYTPEARVGDYVLVHVGFAISRIDESEAQEIFKFLEEIEAGAGETVAGGQWPGSGAQQTYPSENANLKSQIPNSQSTISNPSPVSRPPSPAPP